MRRVRRFQRADRSLVPCALSLDAALEANHPVRAVWDFVDRLPLSDFYREIRAYEHGSGRPPVDPKILLALWVWATKEGVGSARFLAELCGRDLVYRWLCGGVGVNYHLLAHFRVEHGDKLNRLLARILAALLKHRLVTLKRVCQDGTRVRASAGAASFRRESTLHECLDEAEAQLREIRLKQQHDSAAGCRAARAAQLRAAEERRARVEAALREVPSLKAARARQEQHDKNRAAKRESEVRASTTDPEARVMRMPDGGYRPAYNVQLLADQKADFIAGVVVSNDGQDTQLLVPVFDQLRRQSGVTPKEGLLDGAYVEWSNLEALERRGVTVYAPVRVPKNSRNDPYAPRNSDPPAVAKWRRRMRTEEAKKIYRQRGATSERINGDLKEHRAFRSFPVRGLHRVRAVALLTVITFDIERCLAKGWST